MWPSSASPSIVFNSLRKAAVPVAMTSRMRYCSQATASIVLLMAIRLIVARRAAYKVQSRAGLCVCKYAEIAI
jgi:hypothetical protein